MNDPVREYLQERGCAEHVVAGGLIGLVEAWEKVVSSVQSGYPLGLDDYLNDLDARELLEEALALAPIVQITQILTRLQSIDQQMKALTLPVDECLWGDDEAEEEGWTPKKNWWYFSVPKKAGAALTQELKDARLRAFSEEA